MSSRRCACDTSTAALIAAIRLPSGASRGVATAHASANVIPRLKARRRQRISRTPWAPASTSSRCAWTPKRGAEISRACRAFESTTISRSLATRHACFGDPAGGRRPAHGQAEVVRHQLRRLGPIAVDELAQVSPPTVALRADSQCRPLSTYLRCPFASRPANSERNDRSIRQTRRHDFLCARRPQTSPWCSARTERAHHSLVNANCATSVMPRRKKSAHPVR